MEADFVVAVSVSQVWGRIGSHGKGSWVLFTNTLTRLITSLGMSHPSIYNALQAHRLPTYILFILLGYSWYFRIPVSTWGGFGTPLFNSSTDTTY